MPLLTPDLRRLLIAVTRSDAAGSAAFENWRASTPLDDIDGDAFKVMPMLADVAARHQVPQSDLGRMKGVARYIWVANTLQLRWLFEVIEVLAAARVEVMVIKGAALFARDAGLFTKRMSSDYDILVAPGARQAACDALEAAGFQPGQGFSWPEVKFGMPERSGAPIRRENEGGEIDLHWKPLQGISDPLLVQSFWTNTERRELQGHPVSVPSLADHLFATLARAEPWEPSEAFQRLLEAFLILDNWADQVDWARLIAHARRYGLAFRLQRFLAVLAIDCGVVAPAKVVAKLGRGATVLARLEEVLRRTPPPDRSPLTLWYLGRRDRRYHRDDPARQPLPLVNAIARQFGRFGDGELRRQWRDAVQLESRFPQSGLRFAQGFSAAEPTGRWTDGLTAGLRIPLPGGQPQAVSFRVLPHIERGTSLVARTCCGERITALTLQRSAAETETITVPVEPVAALQGDGYVLFDLWFAHSPASSGASPDIRCLGLFFGNERH